MKTLPSDLRQEKNKISTANAWIVLLDVELSASVKFYFCSNNEDVLFTPPGDSQHTYTALPFDIEPFEQTSKGEVPTVTLKICNTTYVVHQYIEQLSGAVGATVTVYVVNTLNAGPNNTIYGYDFADLTMEFTILSTTADAEWIYFQLGAASPLRRRFPLYRVISDHCMWEFRSPSGDGTQVECSYNGALTTCNRSYKRCVTLTNTRRFGGFKGISVYGWRAV